MADFLPTITIKAKDFANEITNFNIKRNGLRTESNITDAHVKNNQEVRRLLKVERRLKSEQRKLPKRVQQLEGPGDNEEQ